VERWRQGYDVVYAVRTQRKEGPIKRLCDFLCKHRDGTSLFAIARRVAPTAAGRQAILQPERA
jgi:hypothetical protein